MSTGTQSNVLGVLVGANPSPIATASVQITDPSATATYIADGQVVILDELDTPMLPGVSNIADSPYIRFVQRSGTELHFSNRLRGIDLVKVNGVSYTAGQEQIWSIGYNGTSGSIDASVSSNQIFTIVNTWDSQMWSEQQNRDAYDIYNASPTQLNIAQSVSGQVDWAMWRRTYQGTGATVKAEMLADGTTQGTANAATLALVNGSDVVTFSAAQTTTILAVGNVLRIGGTTGGGAATTAGPVYIVIANSATDSTLSSATGATPQVRIHAPYQGTSMAASGARGTGWDFITGSSNFGVQFTGLPLTWGIPPYSDFKYKRVQFHFDMVNFGNTSISQTQNSKLGIGDYRLVSELEYFAQGNEGALNRTVIPLPTGRHDTVTGATYDTIYVEWVDRSRVNAVAGMVGERQQLYIFLPDGATQGTLILNQLNPYIVSAGLPTISL